MIRTYLYDLSLIDNVVAMDDDDIFLGNGVRR